MHERTYGPQRVSVELTNICNLHCSYCLRDEDALYHTPARFFPVSLLQEIAHQGREAVDLSHISFTGGEPTLHPAFAEAIAVIAQEGLTTSFVTNGWHFDRVWPVIAANLEAVTYVAFSLDGATREAHDKWRGQGSFVRLVRAFSRCQDRKSTRLNSSHSQISYAVFCLKKKTSKCVGTGVSLKPLRIVLIKPSKYGVDGAVERFKKGFMPNATL